MYLSVVLNLVVGSDEAVEAVRLDNVEVMAVSTKLLLHLSILPRSPSLFLQFDQISPGAPNGKIRCQLLPPLPLILAALGE